MTIDDAQKDLILVVDGATWRLSESALAALDARQPPAAKAQTVMTRVEQVRSSRMTGDAEVLLLGFLDDARRIRDAGHVLLFPFLRTGGQKTALSNLFYKEFRKILIEVLPHAAEERKSFHSLRKDANSLMSNANVNDPIRHAVMGHAHSRVNEKHYLNKIFDAPKLMALGNIPLVTTHLSPPTADTANL